jgi:serine/threonine protein kinase
VSTDAYVMNGYRLTNLMMTGQTSQVWEATQELTGRRYALKMLLPERAREPEHRKYIDIEAKVGKQLQHPKIIKVFEYFREKDNPHFVMEFFPGANLKQRIMHVWSEAGAAGRNVEKDKQKSQHILTNAQQIIEQAAEALAYMHDKGWLHKDIKPDNLLVNGIGEVRLIDFALAERIRRWFGRGPVQGTRSYMSPEQIRNERLDQRADAYSFGCTVYELLTGRPPFRADSPKALLEKHLYEKPRTPRSSNPDLTPEVEHLILQMLSKNRKDRLDNMHEFLAKFRGTKIFSKDAKCVG